MYMNILTELNNCPSLGVSKYHALEHVLGNFLYIVFTVYRDYRDGLCLPLRKQFPYKTSVKLFNEILSVRLVFLTYFLLLATLTYNPELSDNSN
jgi:hypothetical protein